MTTHPNLDTAIQQASRSIAPLWPLTHFVAVNPFQGYADRPFSEAALHLKQSHGDYPLPPLSWLFQQYENGYISADQLQSAIDNVPPNVTAAFVERELSLTSDQIVRLSRNFPQTEEPEFQIGTFSSFIDRREGSRWSHLLQQEAAKWCSAYFDRGQAIWKSPWREANMYSAWRDFACIDKTLTINGLRYVKETVGETPEQPFDAIAYVLDQLEVPVARQGDVLERAFLGLPGWSGYLRYLDREQELHGKRGTQCVQLLAALLGYELILYRNFSSDHDRVLGWRRSLMEDIYDTGEPALPLALALRLVWQTALESEVELQLQTQIKASPPDHRERPELQAVFCIDVRSERFRRCLESVMPSAQTFGFAGFFGIPAAHSVPGRAKTQSLCPVLLAPPVKTASGLSDLGSSEWVALNQAAERKATLTGERRLFREASASCFTFVETIGLGYLAKLLKDAFGLGSSPQAEARAAPDFTVAVERKQRLDLAESILRGIGLRETFVPVVLICGHGSQSANNPYASGLDCGACGGRAGDVNARLAASLLNDSSVRSGLAVRGIAIPQDTVFLAGLHNTTTDEITLFDAEQAEATHPKRMARIRLSLRQAGDICLLQRRAGFAADAKVTDVDRLRRRSRDWSQVRPEWGLAGNQAFIVAPRAWTKQADLEAKAFLHEYDPSSDSDGSILEGILAGPLVVGSWINLQYFASTVDNEVYGSGHKAIHNVVGGIGVASGNEYDLRVGLPWQSVHDGSDFVHRPIRLHACVASDPETIDRILEKQNHLRDLVLNDWIHLTALGPQGDQWLRKRGDGSWQDAGSPWQVPVSDPA